MNREQLETLSDLCESSFVAATELMDLKFRNCMSRYEGQFGTEYQKKINRIYQDAKNEFLKIYNLESDELHELEENFHKYAWIRIFADYKAYLFLDPAVRSWFQQFFLKVFAGMNQVFQEFVIDGNEQQYSRSLQALYDQYRHQLDQFILRETEQNDEKFLTEWQNELKNVYYHFMNFMQNDRVDILRLKNLVLQQVNDIFYGKVPR